MVSATTELASLGLRGSVARFPASMSICAAVRIVVKSGLRAIKLSDPYSRQSPYNRIRENNPKSPNHRTLSGNTFCCQVDVNSWGLPKPPVQSEITIVSTIKFRATAAKFARITKVEMDLD
jgi:hypothetical protein